MFTQQQGVLADTEILTRFDFTCSLFDRAYVLFRSSASFNGLQVSDDWLIVYQPHFMLEPDSFTLASPCGLLLAREIRALCSPSFVPIRAVQSAQQDLADRIWPKYSDRVATYNQLRDRLPVPAHLNYLLPYYRGGEFDYLRFWEDRPDWQFGTELEQVLTTRVRYRRTQGRCPIRQQVMFVREWR